MDLLFQTVCYGGARLRSDLRDHAGCWRVSGIQTPCSQVHHIVHPVQGTALQTGNAPQETFRSLQLWADHAVGTDIVLPISGRLFLLYDKCYGREYCTDEKNNIKYCLVPLPSILNYWKIRCCVCIYGLPMNSFFLDCLKPSATQPRCDTYVSVYN